MAVDRACLELTAHGISLADLQADPRASRLRALLDAARTMDARKRLEDLEDVVNAEGISGETREEGPDKLKTKKSALKVIPVGYNARIAELSKRAYPEEHSPELALERRRAVQQAKAKSFWSSAGVEKATTVRLRITEDGHVETSA